MKKKFGLLLLIGFVVVTVEAFWWNAKIKPDDVIYAADNCAQYDKAATTKFIDRIKKDIEGEAPSFTLMWALLSTAVDKAGMNYTKLSAKTFYEILETKKCNRIWFNWEDYKSLREYVGEDEVKKMKSYQEACNCKEFSRQMQEYMEERKKRSAETKN